MHRPTGGVLADQGQVEFHDSFGQLVMPPRSGAVGAVVVKEVGYSSGDPSRTSRTSLVLPGQVRYGLGGWYGLSRTRGGSRTGADLRSYGWYGWYGFPSGRFRLGAVAVPCVGEIA